MLLHLIKENLVFGENSFGSTVPFTAMLKVEDLKNVDADLSIGSIGGDASGTSWSVTNHRSREVIIIKMPPSLVEVLGQRSTLQEGDIRSQFMISIAEHLVLVFAILQWGQTWKDHGILVIRYMTDNQNSYIWTKKALLVVRWLRICAGWFRSWSWFLVSGSCLAGFQLMLTFWLMWLPGFLQRTVSLIFLPSRNLNS